MNIKLGYIILLVVAVFAVACEEDEVVNNTPDQLFRPVLLQADITGSDVIISWTEIANSTYTLEVSRDSLAFQNELQAFELQVPEKLLEGLHSGERYSARVKAVSIEPSIKDSEFNEFTFVMD